MSMSMPARGWMLESPEGIMRFETEADAVAALRHSARRLAWRSLRARGYVEPTLWADWRLREQVADATIRVDGDAYVRNLSMDSHSREVPIYRSDRA